MSTVPSPTAQDLRSRRVRRILVWIFVANALLVAVKIGVGVATGSLSVLGDAAHSGTDALNNLVALVAIYFAAIPPDERHPYGHGKFETLGAFIIAGFLSVTCYEILKTAIARLLRDAPPPDADPMMLLVLAATVPVNVAIAFYERRRGKELDSELLLADARHTSSDVWVTLSVLGGLGLVRLGLAQADALLAILVAVVVAYSGWQIIRMTVPVLVDERVVDPQRVQEVAASVDGVEGVTQVRSRGRPGEGFAELTVHVRPATHVREAHTIADEVERTLTEELDLRDVVVHVEPTELH
ncbi:MAG: cation transporter [Gemmatimonadetes bacterium]|uniref:Cation transporter n=1 Tax=Candidatus Kutchimonas denitrificans TaxID=3056748 RepID=A0AAE4Z880_9BACT|nr:cation transporter [Gemmatimonadota bacterium]NIR74773.1 cation transporter [Candidatus Kutchimonas denitrificans]NIS01523.1 cation transporter [Gemmatimonadota bacterium]NIT67264.1 cation transporter [Gemmatimonadota bacterium]NIU52438.1 cation diffusion facilitator family transporter [Gemmatimonadota bacterium]